MIRFKICGLCRATDAAAAVAAGADYVGVILAPGTPRSQSLAAASRIFEPVAGASRVGVFVNPDLASLHDAIRTLHLDVVQLHGEEPAAMAEAAGQSVQVWKAVRVRTPADVAAAAATFRAAANGLLLDAYHPARAGGTGLRLNWAELVPQRLQLPATLQLILAGGLTPENVAAAVRALQPDIVDVSSGVERAMGEKSVERMRAFVAAARATAPTGSCE